LAQWENTLEQAVKAIPDNITANEIIQRVMKAIKLRDKPVDKIERIFQGLQAEYESKKHDPSDMFHLLHILVTNHLNALETHIKDLKYKDEFLQSIYWKIVRDYILWKYRYKCILCGGGKKLNVHHKNYNHHGLEHLYLDDLTVLCEDCHKQYSLGPKEK